MQMQTLIDMRERYIGSENMPKGIFKNSEIRSMKISLALKGKKRKVGTGENISNAQKKMWKERRETLLLTHPQLFKKGMKAWNKGLTKETDRLVKQYSEKMIGRNKGNKFSAGRIMSEEQKTKLRNLRLANRQELLNKVPALRKGYLAYYNKESNHKIESDRHKVMWQNEKYSQRMFLAMKKKPNDQEKYIDAILQLNFPKEWQYTGDGKVWITRKNPDFLNRTKKIIIEFDSEYWHSSDKQKEKDFERNQIYAKYGFKIIILNEQDLTPEKIITKIKQSEGI